MKRYAVGIIGAGRIVSEYDSPGDSRVLTHGHALQHHSRFGVVGVYDRDESAAARASQKWGFSSASSFGALKALGPDVLVVAAPNEYHAQYLEEILTSRCARFVLCEKPLTMSLESSAALADRYARANITLAVGYQRRCDEDVNGLRRRILSGDLGAFVCGSVLYSKGLLHNGSHAIDTLRYLLGNVTGSEAFAAKDDHGPDDLTISGRVSFEAADVMLLAGDERCFSLFEIDLVFEKGRYRFTDSGMHVDVFTVDADPHFQGHTALTMKESRPSTLAVALTRLWDEAARSLDEDRPPVNSAAEAVKTQEACVRLAQQLAHAGKRP